MKSQAGETARSLALLNGHPKIVNLIDNHVRGSARKPRREAGLQLDDDQSSSDEVSSALTPRDKAAGAIKGFKL